MALVLAIAGTAIRTAAQVTDRSADDGKPLPANQTALESLITIPAIDVFGESGSAMRLWRGHRGDLPRPRRHACDAKRQEPYSVLDPSAMHSISARCLVATMAG